MKKSLVLFSGGLDSTTAVFWALSRGNQVSTLTFDYGQRHRLEIRMARRAARRLGLLNAVLKVNLNQVGGSALTDGAIDLPRYERPDQVGDMTPLTYVPFRNGILLAMAAAWAEVNAAGEIICGFHVIDSPHYPDTGKNFVEAMERAIQAGTKTSLTGEPIRVVAPFLAMKKSEIIRLGLELAADYSYSISCYAGEEVPCMSCSACLLRQKAWEEAGWKDHLIARLEKEGKL